MNNPSILKNSMMTNQGKWTGSTITSGPKKQQTKNRRSASCEYGQGSQQDVAFMGVQKPTVVTSMEQARLLEVLKQKYEDSRSQSRASS